MTYQWLFEKQPSNKEVSKRRAEVFFRLKQGGVVFADGRDRKVRFPRPVIAKPLEIKEGIWSGII
ncbi:hypothetical protein [Flagellimonas halotolerans]|uniref:DUF4224 domain-containing protein n=1 Tax=Flagellimonas halotolerans TaxID=3112164 RepID=A0ABU6ISH7_9FLAO|nr:MULTISPECIES: hypothetical protein [unclassified Allomuricauda]MEC3966230.1 hypothetical protein [Muricauda sp. SYSU M86414]MEC4266084.1 hypothetical protein [Muricauda sp. SYSU M84420]